MKNSKFYFVLIAILLVAYSFAFAGGADKGNNEIEITPLESLYLGKSIQKVWTISYSEQEKPVTITLHSARNKKEYIVRSEFFEVIYVSDKNGFGVRTMPRSLKEVPWQIDTKVLNQQQLESQKILTPGKVSDAIALGLIADYLPILLNENYRHLIY